MFRIKKKKEKKIVEMEGGNGCQTVWMQDTELNVGVGEMVKLVNFMYVFKQILEVQWGKY